MKRGESGSEVAGDADSAGVVRVADLQRRSVNAGRQEVLRAEINAVLGTVADLNGSPRRERRNRGLARRVVLRRDRVAGREVIVLDSDVARGRGKADRAGSARRAARARSAVRSSGAVSSSATCG